MIFQKSPRFVFFCLRAKIAKKMCFFPTFFLFFFIFSREMSKIKVQKKSDFEEKKKFFLLLNTLQKKNVKNYLFFKVFFVFFLFFQRYLYTQWCVFMCKMPLRKQKFHKKRFFSIPDDAFQTKSLINSRMCP